MSEVASPGEATSPIFKLCKETHLMTCNSIECTQIRKLQICLLFADFGLHTGRGTVTVPLYVVKGDSYSAAPCIK